MSCNMPSRGDSLEVLIASGEETVRDALARLLDRLSGVDYGKLDAVLETESDACSLVILSSRGLLEAVCLDCSSGVYKGARGLDKLRALGRERLVKGFLEALRLSRDAYEMDKGMDGEALLQSPVPYREALEEPRREEPREEAVPAREPEARPAPQRPGVEKPAARAEEPGEIMEEIDEYSLASMLIEMLPYSRLVHQARSVEAAIREAVEASRPGGEKFYRVFVEFRDGEAYSLFFHGGRLCSVVRLEPSGLRASKVNGAGVEEIVRELEEKAREKGLEMVGVYEVDCPKCRRVFLSPCLRGEPERPPSEEKREGRRRRGLFGFLRRR